MGGRPRRSATSADDPGGELGHVFEAFPQRRNRDPEHVETEVEVAAHAAGFERLVHVDVERRDHARVGAPHVGLAEAPELAELEEAEQRRLGGAGHVGELVEEQGSAVGGLDEARLRRVGSGERPARVAEELALEQRLREQRAVHRHEGPLAALAPGVDGPRDELFAGAGLPREQHGQLALRGAPRGAADRLGGRAPADELLEAEAVVERDAQSPVLPGRGGGSSTRGSRPSRAAPRGPPRRSRGGGARGSAPGRGPRLRGTRRRPRKAARGTERARTSPSAVTLAERGRSSRSAISPTRSPGPRVPMARSSRSLSEARTATRPSTSTKTSSPGAPSSISTLPGGNSRSSLWLDQPVEGGEGQVPKHGDAAQRFEELQVGHVGPLISR